MARRNAMEEELKEALIVLGAAGALLFAYLWEKCDWNQFGNGGDDPAAMNRFAIRGLAILATIGRYGIHADVQHARAVMLIIYNESRGDPSNYLGDEDQALPSVGPMQVNGTTAVALGYVSSGITPEAYAAYASNPALCIWWGVGVLKDKEQNDPDTAGDLAASVEAFNGSGAAADAYLATAQEVDSQVFEDQIA